MRADMPERQLVFVVGTRAQLIKVAPVVVACERLNLPVTLLMTGQHRDTMEDLIAEFTIRSPRIPVRASAEHSTLFSLLRWLPNAYLGTRRHLRRIGAGCKGVDVLVHGDTLSALIGAIAARTSGARVIHLESGLTSGRLLDPFPEELCRRLVFRLTDVAMCPNQAAAQHMRRTHRAEVIDTQGNTIVDAVLLSGASPSQRDPHRPYVVASLHRFQNIYNTSRLRHLVTVVGAVGERMPVFFVLHPVTRGRLEKEGLLERLSTTPGVHLVPRMGYSDFLRLAASSACVITDGGSNQEELAALGVPTVVMRARTERPDGLGSNAVMESDLEGDLAAYLIGGSFEDLRRPPVNQLGLGPSGRIALYLAGEGST